MKIHYSDGADLAAIQADDSDIEFLKLCVEVAAATFSADAHNSDRINMPGLGQQFREQAARARRMAVELNQ